MAVNLYRSPLVRPFLRSPWSQRAVQFGLLTAYGALAALGWGLDGIPGVPQLHPRLYTHATTLLFWVVWFMGLVLLAPVVGRAWCAVCPLGFVADAVGRRGLGLTWPRWLPSGSGTLVVFVGGVAAVVWGDVHKSPHATSVFVLAVGGAAALSGLVWRRSAFCKGLCPVGYALHLYSRHAPVAIRPLDEEGCRSCRDHSCTDRQGAWRRWDAASLAVHHRTFASGCPVALHPPTMDQGACLLCLRCVRSCSRENLGLIVGARPASLPLDGPRTRFLVLLTGLVLLALLRTWPAARDALTPGVFPPAWAAALWLGLALPALLLLGPAAVAAVWRAASGRPAPAPPAGQTPRRLASEPGVGFWAGAGRYLAAFVGPVLGAHGAQARVKLNAKAGYLPYLFYDPRGASTYLAIYVSRILPVPDLLLPLKTLRWAALAVLALGVLGGGREAARQWGRGTGGAGRGIPALAFAALSALFGAALVHWLFPWGRP